MNRHFLLLLVLAILLTVFGKSTASPPSSGPDIQAVSRYCEQVQALLKVYGKMTSHLAGELQRFNTDRQHILAGKAYPDFGKSTQFSAQTPWDSAATAPPFPDTLQQIFFSDITRLYAQVMRDCIATRSWLKQHTERYIYPLVPVDSACDIFGQQLRYMHMLHGELSSALQASYFHAIDQTLLSTEAGPELIRMKQEIQSGYTLIIALDHMQLGEYENARKCMRQLKALVHFRNAEYPDASLHPAFMSYDYILQEAFLPQVETLIISCQARDYEYLNQYHRTDMARIMEAYHALTDQFSYQVQQWLPYDQEPEDFLELYYTEMAYPTAPPSTLKQIPLTKEASSEAR